MMIRINFNLTKKHEKTSPISVSVVWDKIRIQKGIGLTVETKYWDNNAGIVKRSYKHSVKLNGYLQDLRKAISDYYNEETDYKNTITKKEMKAKVDEILNNGVKASNKNKSVLEVFEVFMNKYRINGVKPSRSTIRNYKNTYNKLKRFQRTQGTELQFNDIDEDFYNDLCDYLFDKGNNNNSVGTMVKQLKTFMKWAQKRKYHNNDAYKEFKKLKGDATLHLVMTIDEVERIKELSFNDPDLEFSRLFILVQCHIGTRYGDLMKIVKNYDVKAGKKLRLKQSKTLNDVEIDCPDEVVEMINRLKELYKIKKYGNRLINNCLKVVGQEAEMNEQETFENIRGNEVEIIKKQRWAGHLHTIHSVCRKKNICY